MATFALTEPPAPAAARVPPATGASLARGVAGLQALYYLATGLWPLLHLDSFLAIGAALALACVDIVYASQRVIPPVYLLDALAQLGLVAGYTLAGGRTATLRVGR